MMRTTGFSLAITGLLQAEGDIKPGVGTPDEVVARREVHPGARRPGGRHPLRRIVDVRSCAALLAGTALSPGVAGRAQEGQTRRPLTSSFMRSAAASRWAAAADISSVAADCCSAAAATSCALAA